MLSLISFIVVMIGAINWFCIGLLQFDFVAALFGSQSSIFSRIVYIIVGLGALVLLFNLIENKGKIAFKFKKKENQKERQKQDTYYSQPRYANHVEAGQDREKNIETDQNYENGKITNNTKAEENNNNSCESGSCKIDYENYDNNNQNNSSQNND